MKHTKGPWEWQIDIDKHIVIFKADGDIVVRDSEYLMEGDARLIAAAPELYREFIVSIERGVTLGYSCEDQLELYKKITDEEYDFVAAIAKEKWC